MLPSALSSVGLGLSIACRLSQLRDALLNQTRRELTWTNPAPRGAEPRGDLAQRLPRFWAETHEATDGPCGIRRPARPGIRLEAFRQLRLKLEHTERSVWLRPHGDRPVCS